MVRAVVGDTLDMDTINNPISTNWVSHGENKGKVRDRGNDSRLPPLINNRTTGRVHSTSAVVAGDKSRIYGQYDDKFHYPAYVIYFE